MKRRLLLVLIEILCVIMLVGCGQSGTENQDIRNVEKTIFDSKTLWNDSENLYEIPLDVLEGVEQAQVYRFGNDLLFTYETYDVEKNKTMFTIAMVSLENGELLYEQKLEPLTYGVVQILDNKVAVNDLGDGKSYLLNDKLEMIDTYEVQGGMFCLDKKGEKAYRFTYDKGIEAVDLASGKTTAIFDNGANMFLCKAVGNEASFIYTDRDTLLRSSGVLDLSSGEIRTIESPYVFDEVEASGDIWLGNVEGEVPFYVVADETEQGMFYGGLKITIGLNNASGHVMFYDVQEEGESIFLAYDEQGNLLSDCCFEGMTLYEKIDLAWYEEYNGYVFVLTDEDNKAHFMFWDISGERIENDLDLESVEESIKAPEGIAVSQELFNRAKTLSEKYGVEILIADQCDTVFTDHSAELLLDEAEIAQALDTVDYVLGRYPEGFFEQLKHNTYKEIEIQLLGILEKDYSTDEMKYISGGFVNYSYQGKLVMALDARTVNLDDEINPILAGTMYHEFSHIIDKRLEFDARYREEAYYSETGWEELNPEGFEYNDSYYGTLAPQYADYFVDAYACTNSTEDRARIMECAMLGDESVFVDKEGVRQKLEYYCQGIRDSFDTTGWPEILPWEDVIKTGNR